MSLWTEQTNFYIVSVYFCEVQLCNLSEAKELEGSYNYSNKVGEYLHLSHTSVPSTTTLRKLAQLDFL